MSSSTTYIFAGAAMGLLVLAAILFNPWPGSYLIYLLCPLPFGIAIIIEEMREAQADRRARAAASLRVHRFNEQGAFEKRISH